MSRIFAIYPASPVFLDVCRLFLLSPPGLDLIPSQGPFASSRFSLGDFSWHLIIFSNPKQRKMAMAPLFFLFQKKWKSVPVHSLQFLSLSILTHSPLQLAFLPTNSYLLLSRRPLTCTMLDSRVNFQAGFL